MTDPQGPAGTAVRHTVTPLAESIGGWRGFIDGAVPTLAFLLANQFYGLRTAVYVAAACGVGLLVVRLLRRQSLQQAIAGFLGLAFAAYLASRTGKAEGFFLPGILTSTATAAALVVSVLVRRPAVGFVVAAFRGDGPEWRDDARQRRTYTWLTLAWAALYGGRAGISALLYQAGEVGLLGAFKITGTPMYVAAAFATIFVVRRMSPPAASKDLQPAPAPPGT